MVNSDSRAPRCISRSSTKITKALSMDRNNSCWPTITTPQGTLDRIGGDLPGTLMRCAARCTPAAADFQTPLAHLPQLLVGAVLQRAAAPLAPDDNLAAQVIDHHGGGGSAVPAPPVAGNGDDVRRRDDAVVNPAAMEPAGKPVERGKADLFGPVLGLENRGQRRHDRGLLDQFTSIDQHGWLMADRLGAHGWCGHRLSFTLAARATNISIIVPQSSGVKGLCNNLGNAL
jgi:hypothetical protein